MYVMQPPLRSARDYRYYDAAKQKDASMKTLKGTVQLTQPKR